MLVCLLLIQVLTAALCDCNGISNAGSEPETILKDADTGRVRGFSDREDKDIVLGAIIPVHEHEGIQCTNKIYSNETLDYVEAFLYSIDLINNNPNLLPNISLGYDIRDSCLAESTAIEESVDLVLLSNPDKCQVCSADGIDQTNSSVPISAIIGEYASFVSIPIASFLRLFSVPQVSFSSTSTLLNNREQYSYFYRTVPSDDQQAQAMIDLTLHFGWTYVSTIHSNDLYGEPGIDRFKELAEANNICIDLDIGISMDFTDTQYDAVVNRIYNSTPNVIILFSSQDQVFGLFERMYRNPSQRKFLWIASDAWAENSYVLRNYGNIIAGMWGFIPRTIPNPEFYSYFSSLTLSSNKRNKWFVEYYEEYYNCNTNNVSCDLNTPVTANEDYMNHSYTPFVIDAVLAFGHAINDFLLDNCPQPIIWNATARTCEGESEIPSGSILRDYLQNISFSSATTENTVAFDKTGSINGIYRILNYQQTDDVTNEYELVTVGEWDGTVSASSKLNIKNAIPLQFGISIDNEPVYHLTESQCQRCAPGFVSKKVVSSCCGICVPCLGNQYTPYNNHSECLNCSDNSWGNNPLTGSNSCHPITQSYLDPSDAWGIFLIILAISGIICVVFVCIAMGIFWNTPIIKASGREQMIMLLVGIGLCFLSAIFFVIKPSISICFFQRISLWIFFSLILCSLFVKLVRIARIFLRKKTSGRPRFIGPQSQIVFTFLLVSVQLILVFISLVTVYPEAEKILQLNSKDTDDNPLLIVRCSRPHSALIALQMLYLSALLIVSNALAMVTIRFPANFKEIVYVALSTFCIGIIWIAFIITYFATSDEFQAAIVSFAIQMSAFAVLVCMFCPRIFIMIFLPYQNVTEKSFTKSRDLPVDLNNGSSVTKSNTVNNNDANSSVPNDSINIELRVKQPAGKKLSVGFMDTAIGK